MKRIILSMAATLVATVFSAGVPLMAQTPKNIEYVYTEATQLTHIGKLCTDTPNPYHRVDTVRFKGFTKGENQQMRSSAGQAVLFRTNSTSISILPEYGQVNRPVNGTDYAYVGFDLYIKDKNGKWLWAAAKCNNEKNQANALQLIKDMDGSEHECMLYLPVYAELYSLKIGVDKGATLEAMENPFRCRIGIFGSSYTQGISCSRAGMSYPMQLQRMTGYQFLSLGASGNCKMQPYFADVINAYDFDAFVFDCFSNPDAKMIEERLEPFIQKIRAVHPNEPLIFQQTIYRENRNFNMGTEKIERAKQETAARLMKEMCRKYKNVYFIQTNATSPDHESTVDGIHPDDYGYTLWARSIKKPVERILRKHGIR